MSRVNDRNRRAAFRRDEMVEVRSAGEILATLDADGKLDGMPFMPEMARYCGRRFRVLRNPMMTCVEGVDLRRLEDTVFLEGLRCDGADHDGCQRGCRIFWKTAWLKAASGACGDSIPAPSSPRAHFEQLPVIRNDRYYCQSTELAGATSALPRWDPVYRLHELFGDATLAEALGRIGWTIRYRLRGLLSRNPRGHEVRTPSQALNLAPGQWVEIKSREEIEATLNAEAKNRGLGFEPDMLEYCGRRYRVGAPVEKIISEQTGAMVPLRHTVILDGVTCQGHCWRNCPRNNYLFWREIWLKRVAAEN
jgi:hypothetical protein